MAFYNFINTTETGNNLTEKMYPGMDTASNYSGGNPKKNSEAHKTSGYFLL